MVQSCLFQNCWSSYPLSRPRPHPRYGATSSSVSVFPISVSWNTIHHPYMKRHYIIVRLQCIHHRIKTWMKTQTSNVSHDKASSSPTLKFFPVPTHDRTLIMHLKWGWSSTVFQNVRSRQSSGLMFRFGLRSSFVIDLIVYEHRSRNIQMWMENILHSIFGKNGRFRYEYLICHGVDNASHQLFIMSVKISDAIWQVSMT